MPPARCEGAADGRREPERTPAGAGGEGARAPFCVRGRRAGGCCRPASAPVGLHRPPLASRRPCWDGGAGDLGYPEPAVAAMFRRLLASPARRQRVRPAVGVTAPLQPHGVTAKPVWVSCGAMAELINCGWRLKGERSAAINPAEPGLGKGAPLPRGSAASGTAVRSPCTGMGPR